MIAIETQPKMSKKVNKTPRVSKKQKEAVAAIPSPVKTEEFIMNEIENMEGKCLLDHLTHYQEEAYTILGSYFKDKELNRLT